MKAFSILMATVLLAIGAGAGGLAASNGGAAPTSVVIGPDGELHVVVNGQELPRQSGLRVATARLPAPAAVDCGNEEAVGRGFVAFSCESGGGDTRYGHPKELLVVRADGSFLAYRTYGQWNQIAASPAGEVVAAHNGSIVRVTASRITALVSRGAIEGLVAGKLVGDVLELAVERGGSVYVAIDYYAGVPQGGCGDVVAELTASGKLVTLWRSPTGLTCG